MTEGSVDGVDKTDKKVKKIKSFPFVITIIIISIIFFVILVAFSWLVIKSQNLADENKNRITDIQHSRIESCKQNYEGIKEVFKPFFPPPPRTQEQQDNLDKFNATILRLKNNCIKQTKAPPKQEVPKNQET